MNKKLLRQLGVYLLCLLFSQGIAWWICFAGGMEFGSAEAGTTYALCLLFGFCFGLPVAGSTK